MASFGHYYLSKNNNSDTFGCPTTAVVIKDGDTNQILLILNGYDHGDKLLDVAKDSGLIGCVEYFIANIKDANYLPDYFLLDGDSDDINFQTYHYNRVLGMGYTSKIHSAAVEAYSLVENYSNQKTINDPEEFGGVEEVVSQIELSKKLKSPIASSKSRMKPKF